MYRLSSLHAVKLNKPVLRLVGRLFARVALLAVLSSKTDRAPAHRHENQADRWSTGTDDGQLSLRNTPDEQIPTRP